MTISVPVSTGELIDKITILRIKKKYIKDHNKLFNIERELQLLTEVFDKNISKSLELNALINQLLITNNKLWQIEDQIRECERQKDFGEKFITLARNVYLTNDFRANLKRQINDMADSDLIEEKSYAPY